MPLGRPQSSNNRGGRSTHVGCVTVRVRSCRQWLPPISLLLRVYGLISRLRRSHRDTRGTWGSGGGRGLEPSPSRERLRKRHRTGRARGTLRYPARLARMAWHARTWWIRKGMGVGPRKRRRRSRRSRVRAPVTGRSPLPSAAWRCATIGMIPDRRAHALSACVVTS